MLKARKKPKVCLRKGCGRKVPAPRTKYCSTSCNMQHYYVDLRKSPKMDKVCKNQSCAKLFKGTKIQKYCSLECRLRALYGYQKAITSKIAEAPHPCVCCEPAKMIVGKGQYCPENYWMKNITPEDRQQAAENMQKFKK